MSCNNRIANTGNTKSKSFFSYFSTNFSIRFLFVPPRFLWKKLFFIIKEPFKTFKKIRKHYQIQTITESIKPSNHQIKHRSVRDFLEFIEEKGSFLILNWYKYSKMSVIRRRIIMISLLIQALFWLWTDKIKIRKTERKHNDFEKR